ncbi:MAG: DNA topoisomerase 3, partial [Myxococcales bacterium]|nr:DNA topoisomerase 3 [Myxococcales bacterium]
MVRLIVAEKPSVARDIARVLGVKERRAGFLASSRDWVTWCVGHLVELVEPHEYAARFKSWRFDDLPILPERFKLRPIGQTEDQFNVLKRLLTSAEVDEVVNACDAGREGELIFRQVYTLAASTKVVRRLWISALTDEAIGKGLSNLTAGEAFDALGDAARSRAEADWLVGINATRALTLLGRRGGGRGDLLSVGRVQTPTLAMLVRREEEIEAFVPEPFWQVKAIFETEAGERYLGVYFKGKLDRFDERGKAETVVAAIEGGHGQVAKVTEKKHAEPPPLLFDLTELQKVCNRRFGFSAQKTLDIAQSLYETHKVLTYPRTDSRYLSSDQKGELPGLIAKLAVGPYTPFANAILAKGKLRLGRVINDAEVGDHPAIIPTGLLPGRNRLSADERSVFDWVIRRFLAAFMPDAEFARTRVESVVAKHRFLSKGQVCLEAGWQAVEPPPSKRADDDDQSLPLLKKEQPVAVGEVKLHEGKTQPPKRYSEASLLGAMERAGR